MIAVDDWKMESTERIMLNIVFIRLKMHILIAKQLANPCSPDVVVFITTVYALHGLQLQLIYQHRYVPNQKPLVISTTIATDIYSRQGRKVTGLQKLQGRIMIIRYIALLSIQKASRFGQLPAGPAPVYLT